MASEFALVHGMSHGAWAWAEVQTRLERAGHRVVAVDLPGHGRRAHERQRASIESYARAVTDAMALVGLHRAVVVGHSMGGAVIQKVAELAPARVVHLVFLAAIVLPSGSSLLETQVGPATRAVFTGLARAGGGAIQLPAAMEWTRWLGDMTPADSRVVETLIRLTPQPLRPWTERVDLRRFYAMRVPRTYIRCRRDAAVSFARAGEYAARLGVEPIDLDTAHEPMLSDPDTLVAILERCANRRCEGGVSEETRPMNESELRELTKTTARKLFHSLKGGTGFELWKKFDKDLARELSMFFTGKLYSREVISQKQRELCAVAALTVLHRPHEVRAHLHAALNVGATRQEVAEVIFQMVTYGGMPVVVDALEVFKAVLEERGEWQA